MSGRGILFVGNFLSESNAHRHYCEDLADHVEASDWRVYRTSRLPGRVRRFADMIAVTWKHRGGYDVAHVDVFSNLGFFWAETVCFELARLGKPYVLTLRGGSLPVWGQQRPRRMSRLLRSAAAVTAPSTFLRDAMSSHGQQIDVIPNALEIARYPYRARQYARAKLVWLRAFHEIYNPILAVEVVAALVADHHDVELEMIGPDRGDGSFAGTEAKARELGVWDRITIAAGIPKAEIGERISSADIFLNTTNFDNTPVSVLEALACGLCVVSTNVGGIPHLLHHDHNALLVPPRDARAMAGAVSRILGDRALAALLSSNARSSALEYDWDNVLARWNALFENVVARA